MDLQTRRLHLIEYLMGLQDENTFEIIEDAINKSKKILDLSLKPFSHEELIERAKKSNNDYLAGNFKTQEQLEIELKNWQINENYLVRFCFRDFIGYFTVSRGSSRKKCSIKIKNQDFQFN